MPICAKSRSLPRKKSTTAGGCHTRIINAGISRSSREDSNQTDPVSVSQICLPLKLSCSCETESATVRVWMRTERADKYPESSLENNSPTSAVCSCFRPRKYGLICCRTTAVFNNVEMEDLAHFESTCGKMRDPTGHLNPPFGGGKTPSE